MNSRDWSSIVIVGGAGELPPALTAQLWSHSMNGLSFEGDDFVFLQFCAHPSCLLDLYIHYKGPGGPA